MIAQERCSIGTETLVAREGDELRCLRPMVGRILLKVRRLADALPPAATDMATTSLAGLDVEG